MTNQKARRFGQFLFAILAANGSFFATPGVTAFGAQPVGHYLVQEGAIAFQFNSDSLSALGFSLVPLGEMSSNATGTFMVFEVDPSNSPVAKFSKNGFEGFSSGPVMTCGAALLDRPGNRMVVGNFGFCGRVDDGFQIESTLEAGADPLVLFELGDVFIDFDPRRGELDLRGELLLSPDWAEKLLRPDAAGMGMGSLVVQVLVERAIGGSDSLETCTPPEHGPPQGGIAGVTGSDVLVASLQDVIRYTSVGDTAAFAVGTTACNIGNARAEWISYTNHHPVIIQNMYRLKADRFEQIGMSWVKHGFYAVSEDFCGLCSDITSGTELGVGCSDPYSAYLNGVQTNMSPRSTVNAHTGIFPYPWSGWAHQSTTDRRVQVTWSDLTPALNPLARYFIEGHYVHPDDCRAGTQDNNASYREVHINHTGPGVYNVVLNDAFPTHAGEAAVRAWKDIDPSVLESDARVPGEGLFIVASKATPLGDGYFRYNYAVQNLNSDRSARSLRIDLPEHAVVYNPYFRSIIHHSGEPYSALPWTYQLTTSPTASHVSWSTDTFAVNENANALRYDSVFTFAFDTNVEPVTGKATLGLFKPGLPEEITAGTLVPRVTIIDCQPNEVEDRCDLNCSDVGCTQPCGMSDDCNANRVPDECEPDCNGNGVADECDLTQCPPGTLSCADCNSNSVPDGCEPDCDGDGLINECEIVTDTDADSVEDCVDLCPYTTPAGACLPPLEDMVVCCFPSGIYSEMFTWAQCVGFGATPVCDDPPMCPGTACLASACRNGCLIGDSDGDGDLDLRDYAGLQSCFGEVTPGSPGCSDQFNFDDDPDVDAKDYREFSDRCRGPGL